MGLSRRGLRWLFSELSRWVVTLKHTLEHITYNHPGNPRHNTNHLIPPHPPLFPLAPSQSPNASVREAGQSLVRALARGVGVGGGAGGNGDLARAGAQGLALEEMVRGVFCEALGTKTGPNALVQPYQVNHSLTD